MTFDIFSQLRRPLCRLVLVASLVCLAQTGCVRRRMTVRTNPPWALVYVDDQEIGVTPVSASFTYYGTRKIQIFADGYEPLTVKQPFTAPWYQIPPLDFFFENLWPWECRDERVVQFDLSNFGGSALTDASIAVPEAPSEGIPVTYVPARNTVFLSLCLAWAEAFPERMRQMGECAKADYSARLVADWGWQRLYGERRRQARMPN